MKVKSEFFYGLMRKLKEGKNSNHIFFPLRFMNHPHPCCQRWYISISFYSHYLLLLIIYSNFSLSNTDVYACFKLIKKICGDSLASPTQTFFPSFHFNKTWVMLQSLKTNGLFEGFMVHIHIRYRKLKRSQFYFSFIIILVSFNFSKT